jgi:hypothetical protein
MTYYHNKYIKYKTKYLELKSNIQYGGRLPYIMNNDKPEFFPFDNENEEFKYNYYFNRLPLIIKKTFTNFILNDNFEFENMNEDIINNNIYKLVDFNINISKDINIPFNLCLLQTRYKILDNILNVFSDKLKFKIKQKSKPYKIDDILKLNMTEKLKYITDNMLYTIFIINNNNIINISTNYNILLKYSMSNKFLEFLQLIYDLPENIYDMDVTNKRTYTVYFDKDPVSNKINISFPFEDKDINNLYLDFENYIIYYIIRLFVNINSDLNSNIELFNSNFLSFAKNNFEFNDTYDYNEDFKNAVQSYINFSDLTYLFNLIKNTKDENNNFFDTQYELQNQIINKHSLDINKDLKTFYDHIKQDIDDIKKLICFNIYVDNYIDGFKEKNINLSIIFYTAFISYRINNPYLAYNKYTNYLYPINITSFVLNLFKLDYNKLLFHLKKKQNTLTNNEELFYTSYVKPYINNYDGYTYNFKVNDNSYGYINCVENAIFQFIKLLFWKNNYFEIRLPNEHKPNEKLKEIINDLNTNIINISSYYNTEDLKKKIHELFSNHQLNSKYNITYTHGFYELESTIDNIMNVLCLLLNFDNIDELKRYFDEINNHNSNIKKIKYDEKEKDLDIISISIDNLKFKLEIRYGHTSFRETNSNNTLEYLLKYTEYPYFKLILYYSNIFLNFDIDIYLNFIDKENNNKYYKDIVLFAIANINGDYYVYSMIYNYFINDNTKHILIDFLKNDKDHTDYDIIAKKAIMVNDNSEYLQNISSDKHKELIIQIILLKKNIKIINSDYIKTIFIDFLQNDKDHKDYDTICKYAVFEDYTFLEYIEKKKRKEIIIKTIISESLYQSNMIKLFNYDNFLYNFLNNDGQHKDYTTVAKNAIITNIKYLENIPEKKQKKIIIESILHQQYFSNLIKPNNNVEEIIIDILQKDQTHTYYNNIAKYAINENIKYLNLIPQDKHKEIIIQAILFKENINIVKSDDYIKKIIIDFLQNDQNNIDYYNIAKYVINDNTEYLKFIPEEKQKETIIQAILYNKYISYTFNNIKDIIIDIIKNDVKHKNYKQIAFIAIESKFINFDVIPPNKQLDVFKSLIYLVDDNIISNIILIYPLLLEYIPDNNLTYYLKIIKGVINRNILNTLFQNEDKYKKIIELIVKSIINIYSKPEYIDKFISSKFNDKYFEIYIKNISPYIYINKDVLDYYSIIKVIQKNFELFKLLPNNYPDYDYIAMNTILTNEQIIDYLYNDKDNNDYINILFKTITYKSVTETKKQNIINYLLKYETKYRETIIELIKLDNNIYNYLKHSEFINLYNEALLLSYNFENYEQIINNIKNDSNYFINVDIKHPYYKNIVNDLLTMNIENIKYIPTNYKFYINILLHLYYKTHLYNIAEDIIRYLFNDEENNKDIIKQLIINNFHFYHRNFTQFSYSKYKEEYKDIINNISKINYDGFI